MKRHPFRWDALIFGMLFLAVVGTWLSQSLGWFSTDQLAYVLAGALIAVGVAGIVASLGRPDAPTPPPADDRAAESGDADLDPAEEATDEPEEAHPQS